MGSLKYMALGWLAITAVVLTSFINKKNSTGKTNADNKGFAVVELFTSEGCSSCPPADAVIAKIEKESADKPIYILAFHVDYWNRLGWKDIFSSAAYSQRQNQYARWLKLSSVYTPQAVVNGRAELVGSEEAKLRSLIKTDLESQATAQIALSSIKVDGSNVSLQYHTQGNTGNAVLLVAVVQKSAQSNVERGENAGRTLSHVQIVRGLTSIALKGNEGSTTMELPKGFEPKDSELIAFLQNPSNGTIIGATKLAF